MGLFDFFNKKQETPNNYKIANKQVIKFPPLKKPIVPQKMYEIFKEIDKEGMVFFIGTYNEKDREFFYAMADSVFEYLGEFLVLNAEDPFICFEHSTVDIRLIKASIQINYMKSLLTNDEDLKKKCFICLTNLYNSCDEKTSKMNNKWFTDWNNRLIAGLENLQEWQKAKND